MDRSGLISDEDISIVFCRISDSVSQEVSFLVLDLEFNSRCRNLLSCFRIGLVDIHFRTELVVEDVIEIDFLVFIDLHFKRIKSVVTLNRPFFFINIFSLLLFLVLLILLTIAPLYQMLFVLQLYLS